MAARAGGVRRAGERLQAVRALGRPGGLGAALPGGGGRPGPAARDARRDGGPRARLRGRGSAGKGDQAAQGSGRSRGGFSTKIHVLVDALGNPLKFLLTGGAAGDNPPAIPLLAGLRAEEVPADRGDAADATSAYLEQELRATATIPPHPNRATPRACDPAADKERPLGERLIGKPKHLRRAFARFDKYAGLFLAFSHFASATIWLR